ncbi:MULTISPECIES: hypothetical protein [Aeromonas]|uniref:hypothetical protein n=1 Tax=Aeromonas TaxID=642 RepID=UPI0013150553|nr:MULTISPECIES: hypothetical protein [Aeromonas]MDX7771066.1 hypothetical protein [Aeromonas caviae]MDX7846820.1 hypothetical protein [Aeromonas caviae]QQM74590.1 hypothetical protein JH254_13870 [Aeromonas caviae]QQV19488.1 hypothetical protein JJJ22_20555 [Aeromonas caviae]UTI03372.1 hypothetical protein NJR02_04000 [Aeromonas caviae]
MSKTQLFLGLRRENGQIGYLSESLAIPEFFELIRPKSESRYDLIDFSPVIEALYAKHDAIAEQLIREQYNSVFNYWQESKTYSKTEIKLPKFESLSQLSNKLIISLQFRIDETKKSYSHRRNAKPEDNIRTIKAIENNCNIYIDVLLCFIHAKASLEIESFKKDVVLGKYCSYLEDIISDLYNRVVEFSTRRDKFELDNSSLLYHIAFNENAEISHYTKFLPNFDTSLDLRLQLINASRSEHTFNYQDEPVNRIEIEYRTPSRQELEAAKILRDLLYKINSISKLISKLREGNVDWNPSEEGVEELKQLLSD